MFAALQKIYHAFDGKKRKRNDIIFKPLIMTVPQNKIIPPGRVYVAPKTSYDVPLAILRARKEAREHIMKQDRRLRDYVSLNRNMIAVAELDRIIKIRENEYEQYRQSNSHHNTPV